MLVVNLSGCQITWRIDVLTDCSLRRNIKPRVSVPSPRVHPFLFHRGCGGGVAVLPQETLTSVCICCLVASLSVVPLEGLGGTQKLPSRLDELLLCAYSRNLTSPSFRLWNRAIDCSVCDAVGAQPGTIQCSSTKKLG